MRLIQPIVDWLIVFCIVAVLLVGCCSQQTPGPGQQSSQLPVRCNANVGVYNGIPHPNISCSSR